MYMYICMYLIHSVTLFLLIFLKNIETGGTFVNAEQLNSEFE